MTAIPAALGRAAAALAPAGASPAALAVALAAATLVSEDLTCVAAGLLVASGRLSFAVATVACLVGIFVGDLLLVAAGRWLGRPALSRPPLAWVVSAPAVERAARWFARSGPAVVALSRFVPGSRLPLFVAAGVLRAPIGRIALALAIAGGIWTPLLVGLSAATGGAILGQLEQLERWALPVAGAAALAVLAVLRILIPALTWRGRRLLLSRWRRWTRWEFWPLWLLQAPILLYVLLLGLRHRALGLFSAANPGMPAGGFVLESKSAILGAIGEPGVVPAFEHLDLSGAVPERLERVAAAHRRLGGDFPVVGKPDVGERGEGVRILRDVEALATWARDEAPADAILQRYAPGEEFGVFWLRHPSAPRGRIFSITAKHFTAVEGDGRRTLEELILADDRAVCQAPLYLERFAGSLDRVPAAGERVPLVEIGNHCRGTLFLDGRSLVTPELEARIDALAATVPGFCFGRFDLRAPTIEDFRAGRHLAVLELNGVTAEATHIYQPGASLGAAWRTLAEQWRLAFEIGAENVRRGERACTARELGALLAERSRRRRGAASARFAREPIR